MGCDERSIFAAGKAYDLGLEGMVVDGQCVRRRRSE